MSSVVKKEDQFQQDSRQDRKNDAVSLAAEGIAYFNAKSYDKALRCCQQAATAGSLAAQYTLARMYKGGRGTKQSWTNALEWYLKAAEQGYPLAQVALGEMYELGSGVDQSQDKAMEWYRKVAESDDSLPGWNKACVIRARVNLALMHCNGEDVRTYTLEDVLLFHAAAELAMPGYHGTRVMHELGTIHYTGNGIRKNTQLGMQWWQKAANKGHAESHYRLGCAHKERNEMRFLIESWTKAAEQGHCEAAYNLGNLYAEQKPGMTSLKKAKKWWLKAANRGHANAQYRVAVLFETGTLEFSQSSADALKWYQRAADQGHDLSRQKISGQLAGATQSE
jgi:TPR repeat protein